MHAPTTITVSDNIINIHTETIDARLAVNTITGRVDFLDSNRADARDVIQIKTYLSVDNKNLLDRTIAGLSPEGSAPKLTKAWTLFPTGPDIAGGAGYNFITSYRGDTYPLKSQAMSNQNHNICNFKKYSLSTQGPAGDFMSVMAIPKTHGPNVSYLVPTGKPYNFNLSISCFQELDYTGSNDADRTIGLKPQYNAMPNIAGYDKETYTVNVQYRIDPFIGACRLQTFDTMRGASTSFHPADHNGFKYTTASPPAPALLSTTGGPINEAQNQHFLITTVYTGAHAALPAEVTLQIILNKVTKDKIALIALGSITLDDFYQNLKASKDTALTSIPEYQAILAALKPKATIFISGNYSDDNITHGFYKGPNRFFIKQSPTEASFKAGDHVQFTDSSIRTIKDVQAHGPNVHYFYEGEHLDPAQVAGLPMKKI